MPFPKRTVPFTWLSGLFLLNIILRLPDIGHFLTWDEAWLLSSLKEFFGENQNYSMQLWKHPPIFLSLGLLLSPAKPGFEIRMQILSLVINSGALVFFTILFAKLYGRRIALFAGFIYVMLPGTLLFDTWIKRDGLVTLFCALTLLALLEKKDVLAGILGGLCFLSKETAIFFAFGFFLFILFHRPPSRIKRTFLIFGGITFAISSWWYLLFSLYSKHYFSFFKGTSNETGFLQPWWYYFAKLRMDLGWLGLILLVAGIIAVMPNGFFNKDKKITLNSFKQTRFLPIFMIVPGYTFISLSLGKPPWITISFAPFLALLLAFGYLLLFKLISHALHKITGHKVLHNKWLAFILLIGLLSANSLPFNYGNHFKKMAPTQAMITMASYEMSDVVNKNVANNENLLILPRIYRSAPNQADPIFDLNLKPVRKFYYDGSQMSFTQFQKTIEKNKINWALIFPVVDTWQEDLFKQIVSEMDPSGFKFSTGYLLRVDSCWNKDKKQDKEL